MARDKGITTEVAFFGVETARRLADAGKSADLMVANNVLAHVPDLNDFVAGFKILLKPAGTATFEFPHLLNLIRERQIDTIYHEHFSYLSLLVVDKVFAHHGLRIYDVEKLPTHGGSLRLFVCHADAPLPRSGRFDDLMTEERAAGLDRIETYADFAATVIDIKCDLLSFLIAARRSGKSVVGYGAPAKGNTLLNYCGIGSELLSYTVDISPHKQGRYLPGVQNSDPRSRSYICRQAGLRVDPAMEHQGGNHGENGRDPTMGRPIRHRDPDVDSIILIGSPMEFRPTALAGVSIVRATINADERGLFARTYDAAAFSAAGLPTAWPQCNSSWNARKGTLRGMHFQAAPRPDPKLVRCTRGRIFDVAVDLRTDSPTFRGWVGAELSAANRDALAVPAGCAHGFLTLEDDCEVLYMMGEVYVPELARGVRWNDPAFNIGWPEHPTTMSERDANWPDFRT